MATQINWPLGNGQTLNFDVYDTNTDWNSVAGLYIFSYQTANGWRALYVGKTENFQSRFSSHERWNEAVRKGATHIHAMIVPLVESRERWEGALIQHLQPPMNVQHRTVLG